MKEIKISCQTKDYLNFEDLTEFQGNLKTRDKSDIDKIVRSIFKYGFSFPFFIWKNNNVNYVLDGHGRYKALQELDNLGYSIPKLPVVYVDCEDEKSAKDLLLRLNSQYGKMTKESVLDFVGDLELDFSEFQLPFGKLDDLDFEIENKKEKKEKRCPYCGEIL